VSSNLIIGLSEDGNLYRTTIEVDDSDPQSESDLKISEVSPLITSKINQSFRKIAANELHVYGLASSPEFSRIYKIGESLELVAEFPGKHIMDFCVGHGHFVARSDTGAVWNWGHSGRSELASCSEISTMTVCEEPQRVSFFDDLPCIVTKIVCGGWHTLALTSDGDIYSWGWNESGQLGHDSAVSSKSEPYPVDLGSADDPVVDVAAGSRHSVAILKSGLVYSWGRNLEGQCGTGHLDSLFKPQPMLQSWSGVAKNVHCGKWSTFVFTK
jgi:alpha-tubulin suppressor-like RCC1 family protein